MRLSLPLSALAFMLVSSLLEAAPMPTIVVTNNSDDLIQITPIDDTHKAPAPLDQMSTKLPPGSFILTNLTPIPINAVVVLWTYTDNNGGIQQKRFNCDGYITGGAPSPIVGANDSTLISPGGCTMHEHFAHYAAGKPMLGGGLLSSRNKAVSDIADTLTTVRITVDSVIFSDGRIWGPDAKKYYKTVSANYWATRSVVEEISAAKSAGQDMKVPLEKILAEPSVGADHVAGLRKLCASNIYNSPAPDVTLQFYSQQPVLPNFQHIGGDTK